MNKNQISQQAKDEVVNAVLREYYILSKAHIKATSPEEKAKISQQLSRLFITRDVVESIGSA